jgi:3-isopropylmalate dehydratase small subunit
VKAIRGRAWVFGDDVNTDVMAPGLWFKSPMEEMAKHCLEAVDPRFAREVRPGDIVVAGRRFGIGSAREQAAMALAHLGVGAVLAVSFGRIFHRNALNFGLPALFFPQAEEIGAGNDLERATELARKMVCEWGMSDAMGPLTFGKKEEQIFLGREIAQHQDYSEDTAIRIDHEIKRFVTSNYERARAVLEEHKPALLRIAEELLAREVLDAEQVRRIVAGEALEEHVPRNAASAPDDGSKRPAKERPSIVPPLPPLNKPLPQE